MKRLASGEIGDAEFKKLYIAYWSKLYALAYNYFRDKTTAEELVQDVFVHFWEKRKELTHIKDFSSYLMRSMKNKIYDQFDKIAVQEKLIRNAALQQTVGVCSTQELVEFEDTLALLNEEISKLPQTTQTVFKLSRFDRCTNQEIANRINLSSKAVEYHITVALKELHLHLDHLICVLISLSIIGLS
ncbi:MAG: RNA polymerase sigma-70 factor [Chryseolinea sp.]